MPTMRLTTAAIERLPRAKPGKRDEYWDTHLRGFGLRVNDKGGKNFFARYIVAGAGREFLPLGAFISGATDNDPGSLARARKDAGWALDLAKTGRSPKAERGRINAEIQKAVAGTYEKTVADFIELHAKPNNKSWHESQRLLMVEGADWLFRPLAEITRGDVLQRMDAIVARSAPYTANRFLAALKTMFKWAIERELVPGSPVAGLTRPLKKEIKRDRVLTEDELKKLWAAFEYLGWPFGPIFKLLIVTGQRRAEVTNMRWADLDLENKLWTLPASSTKAGRTHEVPLSDTAITIIEALPHLSGTFVFPSKARQKDKGDERTVSGWSAAKKRAEKIAGFDDWRLHDLRRSMATHTRALGIDRDTVSAILNHTRSDVTGIYDRYSALPEKGRALDAWSNKLRVIIEGRAENVLPLQAALAQKS